MRDQAAFYEQPLLSNGSFSKTSSTVFLLKRKSKYKKFLKNFLSKNKFPHLEKVPKSTVPNTMTIDLL